MFLRKFLRYAISAALLIPLAASAGQFSISPVIVVIEKGAKSGSVAVGNEGKEPLSFQIKAAAWSQDQAGKDVYTETTDIVFYPKMLTLAAGEQRIVRIGVKGPAPDQEMTYRLFIEEVPSSKKAEEQRMRGTGKGAEINVVMRIAPPIFRKPRAPVVSGEIDALTIEKSVVKVHVVNRGNEHFKHSAVAVAGRAIDGSEVFRKEVAGWYVLRGASRTYEFVIAPDDCRRAATVAVQAVAETLTLDRTLDVRTDMCSP